MITEIHGVDIAKLQAAALFASRDETRFVLRGVCVEWLDERHVLFVGTDGRRLGVVRVEIPGKFSNPRFESFIIPRELIEETLEWNARERKFNELADEFEWNDEREFVRVPVEKLAGILYDSDVKRVMIERPGRGGVFATAVNGRYPDWRKVLPPAMFQARETISFNPVLMADFARAAELLGVNNNLMRINVSMLDTPKYGSDGLALGVRFAAFDDFYCVLMPCRDAESAVAPEWLVPAAATGSSENLKA